MFCIIGDEEIKILGRIIITPRESKSFKMKSSSCLRVRLIDISFQDVASNVLSEVVIDVSSQDSSKLGYMLTSKLPSEKYLRRTYAVSATLNHGWCKKENSVFWLKKNDYINQKIHRIQLQSLQKNYVKDIHVSCHGEWHVFLKYFCDRSYPSIPSKSNGLASRIIVAVRYKMFPNYFLDCSYPVLKGMNKFYFKKCP